MLSGIALSCIALFALGNAGGKDANYIFQQSVKGIVELKAVSKSHTDNFGTAVAIDEEGTLISNAHLVLYKRNREFLPYDGYFIRMASEEDYHEAKLLKYDLELDIAVLSFADKDIGFCSIPLGDSSAIDFGDSVYAIGNALNYGISMEKGIVSIPQIKMEYDGITREVIQCDLNIANGSSGGALLDENGQLIGITSFRTKDLNGEVVYGFAYAVPMEAILHCLHDSE